MRTESFVITGRLDGLNAYTRACRSNKYVGGKMKRANTDKVANAIRRAHIEPMRTPVDVHIDWIEAPNRGKMRDPDNIQFGVKFILDALVECGVIEDDSFDNIEVITHKCYRASTEPRIYVTISEVNHE